VSVAEGGRGRRSRWTPGMRVAGDTMILESWILMPIRNRPSGLGILCYLEYTFGCPGRPSQKTASFGTLQRASAAGDGRGPRGFGNGPSPTP
jgi:hypothetical protein